MAKHIFAALTNPVPGKEAALYRYPAAWPPKGACTHAAGHEEVTK